MISSASNLIAYENLFILLTNKKSFKYEDFFIDGTRKRAARGGVNAQPQEIQRDLGSFNIIPKNLTTDGISKAYVVDGINYAWYSGDDATFKIFDKNFDVEKTFKYVSDKKEWTATRSTWTHEIEVTRSDLENARFVREEGEPEKKKNSFMTSKAPDTVYCGSMDEFKAVVRSGFYVYLRTNVDDSDFFVDQNGNWAISAESAHRYSDGTEPPANVTKCSLSDDSESATVHTTCAERYYYYNRTDSCMYEAERIMEFDRLLSDADFTLYETKEYSYDVNSKVMMAGVTDAENAGGYELKQYVTQNLLNDDDKYEYLVARRIYEPASVKPILKCEKKFDRWTVTKTVRENDYDLVGLELEALNEDGEELFRLSVPLENDNFYWNVDLYVLNGMRYISVGYNSYTIYLIDPKSPDGVKEVARTKPAEVTKTYNAAGVQVDKDAKGIVITDNGMKYINR